MFVRCLLTSAIDFSSSSGALSSVTLGLNTDLVFHAVTMSLIFLGLMPTGTYMARFGRFTQIWPIFHKSTLTLVCAAVLRNAGSAYYVHDTYCLYLPLPKPHWHCWSVVID